MTWANQYRRNEDSRRAILAATLELCREVGFGGLRIEVVARRAGTGKQTIYRWWPSKGALLLDAVIDVARDSERFPDTGDVRADLCEQMSAVGRQLTSPDGGPVVVGLMEGAQLDAELAERFRNEFIRPRRSACRIRLRAAVQCGELPAGTDLDMFVDQLYGPVYYRALVSGEPLDEAYLRRHLNVLLAGVVATEGDRPGGWPTGGRDDLAGG